MSKVYIAAVYERREEMQGYIPEIVRAGHEVTSPWLTGTNAGKTRSQLALGDLEDVSKADVLLAFTSPYGHLSRSQGRHVELGYAICKGLQIHLIGEREDNIFHHHPTVRLFSSFEEWIRHTETVEFD